MKPTLFEIAEQTRADAYPSVPTTLGFAPKQTIKIVAEGDSWFSYFPAYDVLACLRQDKWGNRHYDIKGWPRAGSYLNDMVYSPHQLADTLQQIIEHRPQVFLFSGGGNDIAGPELFDFLWNKFAGNSPPEGAPPRVLNAKVVQGVVDEVFEQSYRDLIEVVRQCAERAGIKKLPIIFHGYGHAIPDGRGWGGGGGPLPGPWLDPSLTRKNWERVADATARRDAIRQLIDAFNAMQVRIAADTPDVHHVDVRGLLNDDDWGNELHPTKDGFMKVATAIEAKLRQVVP